MSIQKQNTTYKHWKHMKTKLEQKLGYVTEVLYEYIALLPQQSTYSMKNEYPFSRELIQRIYLYPIHMGPI